jgi:hypothetical protein
MSEPETHGRGRLPVIRPPRAGRRAIPIAALVAAALFVVAFATSLLPWLTRDRTFISSTPTSMPRSAITDLRLKRDAVLCVGGIDLDSTAGGLQLALRQVGKTGVAPALRVDVQAAGYRSASTLAGGAPFDVPVVVPVTAPPGALSDAKVCLRNTGRTTSLVSTADPAERSAVTVALDGKRVVAQPWLTFVERRPASVLAHAGEIFDRIAAFRPFPAVPLLLGVLAALVLLGVPAAVIGALALAERADGDEPADDPGPVAQ